MKKIIVAGAGHGGLTAAANLAKNGFDVTVLEQNAREDVGHDWHDCMVIGTFENCSIPKPDMSNFKFYINAYQHNPSKTVELTTDTAPNSSIVYVDRKFLIRYLMDHAEKCGVKFVFGSKVTSAVIYGGKVSGIRAVENGEEKTYDCDLVIDAAGMDSPVRKSLLPAFNIQRDIAKNDTFFVYRAYYNIKEGNAPDNYYNIYFFHNGAPGLDWLIKEDDFADILVGGFGSLSQEMIDHGVNDFKEDYGFIGDDIVRGGRVCRIPLRKTLPMFVADGYAAVGDSACMTEPLSGSGISLSMNAGKILADTMIFAGDDCADIYHLWKYQYTFLKKYGFNMLGDDIIKGMLSDISADDLDFLFEKKVLTAKEMFSEGGKYSFKEILSKLNVLKKTNLYKPLLRAVKRMAGIKKVTSKLPEKYNSVEVREWIKLYDKL